MQKFRRFIAYILILSLLTAFSGINLTLPVTAVTAQVKETLDTAAEALRQGMVNREAEIAISYPASAAFNEGDIWTAAISHTGNPKEGDYLARQITGLSWNITLGTVEGVSCYTVTYMPDYFTTSAQEAEMDTAVAALLNQLNVSKETDSVKFRAIYDWMCENITYDNSSTATLKHSAYAALVNKTAVCQGYALLLYRLCLELGIDTRYISGTANGENHGWNIVRLDGLYYNADATWDATRKQGGGEYMWCLRGASNFNDHISEEEFSTPEFCQQYPMDPNDFGAAAAWPISGKCGDKLIWTLTEAGVLTVYGSGSMYDYYASYPDWYDYAWNLKSVVIEKSVTSVGAYAFYHCPMLESVTIAGSTAIGEAAFLNCAALKTVSLPNATAIGSLSFMGCENLSTILIGPQVSAIGLQAFNGCKNLATISVDSGNRYFAVSGGVLFSADSTRLLLAPSNLSGTYVLPSIVTQVDEYAFANCALLEEVTLNTGIKSLSEGVFFGCASLKKVSFPEKLTYIGDMVFAGCENLASVRFPEKLEHIGYRAFEDCLSLTSVQFPESVSFIGELAFHRCGSIKTVKFLGEAPEIADDSFTDVFADASYPDSACYKTWTHERLTDYGGYLYWTSYAAHTYTASVTHPNCTEQGYTTHTCSHCGGAYVDTYIAALGHSWDEGTVTQQPTITAPGIRTFTCKTCGDIKTEEIETLDHSHTYEATVTAPGCTTQGYTTYSCTQCEHSCIADYVAALNHSYGPWQQTAAAACNQPGTERRDCSRCDHFESRQTDALGHSFTEYISDGNATCSADGTKTAACDRGCGATHTVADPGSKTAHTFGEWYEEIPAAPGKEGTARRDCEGCDHYEQKPIPALAGPDRITSEIYTVGEGVIRKIPIGTTVSKLLQGIAEAQFIQVWHSGKEASPDSPVATGMELRLVVNGETVCTLIAVVTGDVTGDGAISVSDMLAIKSHLLKKSSLAEAFLLAADANGDGNVSISDFIQVKSHILKKSTIAAN